MFSDAVVLVAQVLLLAVQIKREQQVTLVRVWAVEIVAPFGRAVVWITDGLRGAWSHYIGLCHVREENDRFRAEIARLKLHNAKLESRAEN